MNLVVGIATMVMGAAYLLLGTLCAIEAIRLAAQRGVSWFQLSVVVIAWTSGPHHLAHGWHMTQGTDPGFAMLLTTLIALPPVVTVVWLRFEVAFGRRGDRFVTGTPGWLTLGPLVCLLTFGGLVGWGIGGQRTSSHVHQAGVDELIDSAPVALFTNIVAALAYALVGWYLARAQLRRRRLAGGWSLSGLAISAIFPTCALMHLAYGMTAHDHPVMMLFDLAGVPASIGFAYVVHRLYRRALVRWDRHPLAGDCTQPPRTSPWAAA